MSQVVAVAAEDFAVIASDGLVVDVQDGKLVPTGDQYCKFWTVNNGDIAMASTGSLGLNREISRFCVRVAEQHRDDLELFEVLVREVPAELERLKNQYPAAKERIHIEDGEPITLGGTNLLITGYDASQQRIRSIYWGNCGNNACCQDKHDLTPHNCEGQIRAIGYGKDLVMDKLDVNDFDSPPDVVKLTENVIRQAAEAFPKFVGGTIYSHVIMVPELKSMYEAAKDKTSVGHAVI